MKTVQVLVSDKLLANSRRIIQRDGLVLRKAFKAVLNTSKGTVKGLPVIEVRTKASRKYTILSLGELWNYETEAERDAVFAALTSTEVA